MGGILIDILYSMILRFSSLGLSVMRVFCGGHSLCQLGPCQVGTAHEPGDPKESSEGLCLR